MCDYFKNKLYLGGKGKPSPTKMTEKYIKEKYSNDYEIIKEYPIDFPLFTNKPFLIIITI